MRRRVQRETLDLFPVPAEDRTPSLTPSVIEERMVRTAVQIAESDPDNIYFHHAVLCQVGIPRRKTTERVFTRRNGDLSVQLEAGRLFDGKEFVEYQLPYGTKPRLALVYASSYAIKNKTRTVDVGGSMRQFLGMLALDDRGRNYRVMREQTMALAASRMTLGMRMNGKAVTIKTDGPVEEFAAFLSTDQQQMWPGELVLSEKFYESLRAYAVPIDPRALGALSDTALGMDIYTWLTHRLRRIAQPNGLPLTWKHLQEQFGQEYSDLKDFKKSFLPSLRRVLTVYPEAHVETVDGGIKLYESAPPVRERLSVSMLGSDIRPITPPLLRSMS